MNVLITGGSGYLGSIFAEKLYSDFSIICGSQKKILSKKKIKKIKYKKLNYKSFNSLKKNFKGIDVVIHLVGMNKSESKKKGLSSLIFKEKVTLNILKACKLNNVKKLIYISSSQIYKNFQSSKIDENSDLDKGNFYSKGHILAEKKISQNTFNNYIIIRASNIFGYLKLKRKGEQKKNLVHMFCEEAFNRKLIEIHNPNVIKNFLPISVLIDHIKIVLKTNKYDNKIINLGSRSLTLYNLALQIQRRFKLLKKEKIKILINQKLFTKKPQHKFKSLIKKIIYSPKLFNNEIDNIIRLLSQKKI